MPYTIHFISLGCAKNVVNCEQMMELCRQAGYTVAADPAGADVAVVNTCGFLTSANEEAIEHILRMAELKQAGALKKILVTGCMTQRYQKEIPGGTAGGGRNSGHRQLQGHCPRDPGCYGRGAPGPVR